MFDNLPNYQPANPTLWQGRTDTTAGRFFQHIHFIAKAQEILSSPQKTILIGLASDAGILRNQGRPGAKLGPDEIKTHLAKLPCFIQKPYIDLGNIVCEGDDLESAQHQFGELIHYCQKNGHFTIGLGGGHEIAWGHYQGLSPLYSKLGIINFDAHFDLRPLQNNEGNSGTPFSQIATFCKQQARPFHYCCIGIQQFSNTPSLFTKAQKLKVKYLTAEFIQQHAYDEQITFLEEFMRPLDAIYLTICLDVLAECYAPGVSAPQPMGLSPWQILPLLKHIMQSGKVVSLDIAELSPPMDRDQKTAKLAALILAELLHINN